MTAIELSLFAHRIRAVCEEMGAVLQRAAFSPNIRDRLDFSCAVFDASGYLSAQAAHIPVHLGSMAYAMRGIVSDRDWAPGDMLVLNDPFLGGTHLPDVTMIAPLFDRGRLIAFVANRAHHADIGAESPGSMPLSSSLDEEGLVIAPTRLLRDDRIDEAVFNRLVAPLRDATISRGDFSAQISANRVGLQRLQALIDAQGADGFLQALTDYNEYARRLAASALAAIPDGDYRFTDHLDDDGQGNRDLAIACRIRARQGAMQVDFTGSAGQTAGNVNCPISVTAAATLYVFRCLMPADLPGCAGAFHDIDISAPAGSLLNAQRPAAVAAGNVETSQRIVDAVLGALAEALPERIPAASHGGMNNLAMGWHEGERPWDYYETMGGGLGGGPVRTGASAVQAHMTNTRNTPVEVLERHFPVRVRRYEIRRGTGGGGRHPGGDGLLRELEFLGPARYTLLTERRRRAPWGLAGGGDGAMGDNRLNGQALPGKCQGRVGAGDRLVVASPGGGGWGPDDHACPDGGVQ
ncbi:hydantoinase B/oxoprolinase family protein [Spectribacter hydrogenoxidans]|uniref:Hydantoinase B/oxoprolinase family protein n=1 Tax=Spectribacter hydrogenoxidans TaxID=3075608 RepID=A0ABU3BXP5_9GAMM|nr:hydantoinase B/oxoprolinase family protein [Salinisphaera sp. W335]MDT0634030.1 hydantoinase B/oxoprolinase family protein [Salinisphaera sp. W335]